MLDLGIPVAELSMDGQYTIDTYLNHTEGIGPNNLTDFTLCLRFYINTLKPFTTSLLSYSNFLDDNALAVDIRKISKQIFVLIICKYGYSQVSEFRHLILGISIAKLLFFRVVDTINWIQI